MLKVKILKSEKGQTTVEYLLILASTVGLLIGFGIYFHQKLIGAFFTVVGLVLG